MGGNIMAQVFVINYKHKFDVFFTDGENSNYEGFAESFEYCEGYIGTFNGSGESYFGEYKGGTVSIYDIDDDVCVYSEEVR